MKIIQSKFEYSLIVIILALVLFTAYLFYSLYSNQEQLLGAQNKRYKTYLIATQLRLSSDDLTRLVRTYVATNNPKFEKQYWKVLAIRNGEASLPEHYDRVYWDFLAIEGGTPPFPDEAPVSLRNQMEKMNFSEEEFYLLETSQKNSDELVNLEMIAMNAMKGKFLDKNGNFTLTGPPDQRLALEILHGEKYHKAKVSIMAPINEFYEKLDQRTRIQVNQIADKLGFILTLIIPVFILTALTILVLFFVRKRNQYNAVGVLNQKVTEIQKQSEELEQAAIERKKAQDELQSILNKTPDIIYRLDPEGNITFISEVITKYGFRPENLIGKSIMDLIHPDDWPATQQRILERRSGKRSANDIEVRLSVLNSESEQTSEETSVKKWIPFYVSSEGLYSEEAPSSGSYIGTQGIARDISRLRHFEQQVNILAAVVEQAAEDVIITDREGVIQYVNPRFEEVTGYSPSEVIGKTPGIFKSDKQDAAFYAELWGTIKNGRIWKGEIWNKIKDGTLIFQDVTITPIFDSAGNLSGYASVRRDITEQNQIRERLQQAQKMEAIGTLAGGIAHDFNNILAGMIGYTELALSTIKDNPSINDMLVEVLEAGSRATDLVRQILTFSRIQKSEVKPISPVKITGEVLKLLRASLPSTIAIEQSLNTESYIQADGTKIHQVLMNLCTNAAHTMREKGGVLKITLEDEYLGAHDISMFPDLIPGDYIRLSVKDTGPGISPENMDKIFEPYFTTKGTGEGTGLGLAVVHGIVKEYGGDITVESEEGKGTTFHILFPQLKIKPSLKPEADNNIPSGNEHILFIDDEKQIADLVKRLLENLGYKVTALTSSIEALEIFRDNPEKYDLIITDMTMPNMTGKELAGELKKLHPGTPVILSTGFSDQIDAQEAEKMGIEAFIMKPVVRREIANIIREILDNKGKTSE